MTTKADIRDTVIGLRILAHGVSNNLTGLSAKPAELDRIMEEVREARESIKRALDLEFALRPRS